MSSPTAELAEHLFQLPADTPTIDESQVSMLREAGGELIAELMGIFTEECGSRLLVLQESCQMGSREAIRLDVHFIAGSAANMGLFRLAELCRKIEEQIKNSRFSNPDETAALVEYEYETGLAALALAFEME